MEDKFGGTVFTLNKKTYSPRHFKHKTHTSYLLTSLEGQQVCEIDQLKITWLGNNVKHGGKITWRARPSLPRLSGSTARPRSRWKGVSYCRDCPNHMADRTFPIVDQSSPLRLLSRDWGCNWGRAQAAEGNRFDKIQKSFCDPDLWIYPRYDHTLNSMLKIFNPDGVLNAGGLDLLGGRRLTAEPAGNGRGEPRETWM